MKQIYVAATGNVFPMLKEGMLFKVTENFASINYGENKDKVRHEMGIEPVSEEDKAKFKSKGILPLVNSFGESPIEEGAIITLSKIAGSNSWSVNEAREGKEIKEEKEGKEIKEEVAKETKTK